MSSGLEASIAGAETHMLGELSYALPASAQYMKKREEIYWTSGANVYAANGIRTMRVNISGQGFLDMCSLVLECDVDNLSTTSALKPLVPGLEGFFQSLKVSISGTTVEEIGDPSLLLRSYPHHAVEGATQGEDRDEWSHGIRIGPKCRLQSGPHARNDTP